MSKRTQVVWFCLFAAMVLFFYTFKVSSLIAPPVKPDHIVDANELVICEVEANVRYLQKLVGAEQDGVVGYDTMKKVNDAVKAERKQAERDKANKNAEKYFTVTGEPNGE
ncbi:MAG: hypothetical protein WC441_04705 [Patescibacteria group bacterium]